MLTDCWKSPDPASSQSTQRMTIPIAVYTGLILLMMSSKQPVNIMDDYTNCCLYRVDPLDDEQQACSKHVEHYY
jgi:hypothetical protein